MIDSTSNKNNFVPKIKIVLIGDSSVGKTAIFQQIEKKQFNLNTSPTVGGACANITVSLDQNEQVPLIVWDTAGQESFRSIVPMYFSRAAFILIVYDISLRSSFEHVEDWFKLSHEKAPEWAKIILIGNKSDLDDIRKVSFFEGNDICAKMNGFFFCETSALSGAGIEDLLVLIAATTRNDVEAKVQYMNLNEKSIFSDDYIEIENKKCAC